MILLIDNYDSFSYNLYQLVGSLNPDITVIRNDEKTIAQIEQMNPDAILLSPGPGRPKDAGICIDVVKYFADKIPILGVCLGHQSIFEAFGGCVSYAKELMHGKQSDAFLDTSFDLFKDMPEKIKVARYHSLAGLSGTLPEELKVAAVSDDGEIMAVAHKKYPVYGVQFHPESIMTPMGKQIMKNFLSIRRKKAVIREAIIRLADKKDLSYEMAEDCMDEIMSGDTSTIQTSAFLTALSMKGETIDEITACASGMRKHCVKLLHDMDVLEIVGTGGDRSNSFNISTTSSLVVSAAGIPIAKHGNRAASSKCGAADVLEALGVNITVSPKKSKELLEKIGICFLFAQNYHIAMKYVAPVRRELGIRTVFNILGPLANPAGANMQLMGVYSEELVEPMAHVLSNLGVTNGMVVFGQDGLDEISVSSATTVCEIRGGELKTYEITPEQFGMPRCAKDELVGGTPQENAEITKAILSGEKGAKRNAVVLNSAAALYIAKPEITLEEAVKEVEEIIDSKKAAAQLEKFIALSNE